MAVQSIYVVTDQTGMLPELCAGAKGLADTVTAVMFGDQTAGESVVCDADKLIYCPLGEGEAPEDYAKAIAAEIKKVPAAFVLLDNGVRGRQLAGQLGALLNTAALTSVSELAAEDGTLVCRRMVYGGTAQRSIVFTAPYGVITLGNGVFAAPAAVNHPAVIAPIEGGPQGSFKRLSRNEKKERAVNLAAAKRIVDVGRGLAKEADLEMCRKLAALLDAEVGCSRPMAENNKWLPKSCYMGITGVGVKPDLCLVLGVSGQIQHIGGINKSKVIAAVNKDKAAPIFKNADFGIVGDIYKVVPALIEKLS